jgi:hypothetical protein
MKSSNAIAKKATNQGKSRQVRTRFSPFATHEIKQKSQKSSKVKPGLNEVFALRHARQG